MVTIDAVTRVAVVAACVTSIARAGEPKPILCRGHYHSEAEAVKQLARMATTYSVSWRSAR